MWNFLHGAWFLDLEFSGVVTQFCSYEVLFCLNFQELAKVKNEKTENFSLFLPF